MIVIQLQYRRFWLALVGLMVAAIVAVSLSPEPLPAAAAGLNRFGHFAAYLLLALLGIGLVQLEGAWRVIVRAVLLGIALELAQALLTDARQAEWADVGANAAGVIAAWLLAHAGLAGWALRVEAWIAGQQRD